jgi:armadillo repeat-containing protein 8
MSIGQLLGQAIRNADNRRAVTDWAPEPERSKEMRTRRGWEKTAATGVNALGRQGGWVIRHLVELLDTRDVKVCVELTPLSPTHALVSFKKRSSALWPP